MNGFILTCHVTSSFYEGYDAYPVDGTGSGTDVTEVNTVVVIVSTDGRIVPTPPPTLPTETPSSGGTSDPTDTETPTEVPTDGPTTVGLSSDFFI